MSESGSDSARRQLALAHLTFLDATPPRLVGLAAQAGFDAVGLRLHPSRVDEQPYPMVGNSAMRRETLAALRDTGIQVLDIEVIKLRPALDVKGLQSMLDASEELGARYLLVNGEDDNLDRSAEQLAALGEMAARHRMQVGVEFMVYSSIRSMSAAAELVRRVGRDDVFVVLDTLHFDRAGHQPGDIAQLGEGVVRYLQLADGDAARPPRERAAQEARTARRVPGEGAIPLEEILGQFANDLPLSVEVPNVEETLREGEEARARRILSATRALLGRAGPAHR